MDVTRCGQPRELPASIDLSAYRIVQEALTNVVKHARTSACRVLIGYGHDELIIEVTDNGAGLPEMAGAAMPHHGSNLALAGGPALHATSSSGPGWRPPSETGPTSLAWAGGFVIGGSGHGIIGMRERVSLLGGEFSAGPLPGYGFQVSAHIPLPCSESARMTLRVVVADDQALVRVGFCGIITATPGFTVVGEAGNGAEAVEAARRTSPDVILMDVRMPVMDGIEATQRITESSDVRVLILTTFDLDEYVFAALRAGASGFLLKDTLPADLLTAIRVVAAGDALLAPSVTRRLIGEFARTGPVSGPVPGVTTRPAAGTAQTAAQVSDTSQSRPDRGQASASAHRPRARGAQDGRPRHVQRGDRRGTDDQPGYGQDPRGPPADQARRQGPHPAGHHRLPVGPSPGLVGEVSPVVLEDEADRGEHGEQHPDQEEPPADREARAATAAASPMNSGHQLCGLKNPISPLPCSISP